MGCKRAPVLALAALTFTCTRLLSVRHGFTHVAPSDLEATITAYNHEGVVMGRFSMPAR